MKSVKDKIKEHSIFMLRTSYEVRVPVRETISHKIFLISRMKAVIHNAL